MPLNKIAKRLDPRLDEMTLFHELTETESAEFERLDREVADLESNMTLSGTTERTIDRKEKIFGVANDDSKSLEDRRSVLLARFRGNGATTEGLVKRVAESFENGNIRVVENTRPYVITIEFVSNNGIPNNLGDFKAALEEIKPAHIEIEYVYTSITWNDYEGYNKTWDEWEALNLTWDELETYKG